MNVMPDCYEYRHMLSCPKCNIIHHIITFKSGIAKSTLKNLVIEIKGIFFTRDPFTLIAHSRFSS